MKQAAWSILFMFVSTLVFAALVSGVKLVNQDRIELNQQVKLKKIILRVLGVEPPAGAADQAVLKLFSDRVEGIQVDGRTVYVGYGTDHRTPTGYAFPVGGAGFWGPIAGMAAVDRQAEKIKAVAFYKHNETPGLGGRMTEKWFRDQFAGLPVFPIEGDKKIFYLKPSGAGSAPNDLDAITGASRTSAAVETFLNRDLDDFLKNIWPKIPKDS